ncbi:hypothetical protein HOP52_06020 [Halomonas campisalis]|uniref:Cytochrome P450 n=1 Tax=Billgrantia campisalis TaxID=74661 RepID=A0ABS9P6D1_9GAMM|nr:hypothetical protein [Halomonas campisalis]MCG6657328.1 hypothetical protein [Halomonas campisalis]MDR5864129.1 hypothetical protein [Halomonas campisalis]
MARRVHIPGLISLLEVTDPREIRLLDGDSRLDRSLAPGGGVINRLRLARLRRAFVFDAEPLPALLGREAQGRESRHAELERRLDECAEASSWRQDPAFKTLVEAVARQAEAEALGPAAQGLLGRRFRDGYHADEATFAAARRLNDYPRVNAPRALLQRLSGRLRRDRRLLHERAQGDPMTLHATGVAVHNLVGALEAMRSLAGTPGASALPRAAVLARCLSVPETLLRQVQVPLSTPCSPRRLVPGDLVLLRLAEGVRSSGDRDLAFMADSWGRCPAQRFILALLTDIWEQAVAASRSGEGGR